MSQQCGGRDQHRHLIMNHEKDRNTLERNLYINHPTCIAGKFRVKFHITFTFVEFIIKYGFLAAVLCSSLPFLNRVVSVSFL